MEDRASEATLGRTIRRLMGMHICTHQELADAISRSRPAVQAITGGSADPSLSTAQKIAEQFGVTVDELAADPIVCLHAAADAFWDAPIRSNLKAKRTSRAQARSGRTYAGSAIAVTSKQRKSE